VGQFKVLSVALSSDEDISLKATLQRLFISFGVWGEINKPRCIILSLSSAKISLIPKNFRSILSIKSFLEI